MTTCPCDRGRTQRCHPGVGPGVGVGANDVMGDQIAIDVELGYHGRGRTTVGVKAKLEAGVVIGTYK